jgi:4-hydroxy-3-methylbut-2-en-1-yl diphosphate synthase IspG/GcpE
VASVSVVSVDVETVEEVVVDHYPNLTVSVKESAKVMMLVAMRTTAIQVTQVAHLALL